jgi:hypothetical protein
MKTINTLSLGFVIAIAGVALLNVGTASANSNIAFCKVKILDCPANSVWGAGTAVLFNLKNGTKSVVTGSLKIECAKSHLVFELKGSSLGATLLGKYSAYTFDECSTCPIATILYGSFDEAHVHNVFNLKGLWDSLLSTVHWENCFGFAKCTASAKLVELDIDTSVTPPVLKAVNEKLTISGFGCGSEGIWNAEYVMASPSPVYIES